MTTGSDFPSAPQAAPQTIAIIGGGLSGTLVAVHLLQSATAPIKISLIERRTVLGEGVAYSTPFACHLLNVPASKMSAFADQPNHFLDWAQRELKPLQPAGYSDSEQFERSWRRITASHRSNLLLAEPPSVVSSTNSVAANGDRSATPSITAQTFAPRQLYGKYLQFVLNTAIKNAPAWVQWERIVEEAVSIQLNQAQFDYPQPKVASATITLSNGKAIQADQVVLALGNFPPKNPPIADPSFYQSRRYLCSAWSRLAQACFAQADFAKNDAVLLIGSGLTAIDQVVALHQQGHRGKIWLVSRRGLLPQAHPFPPAGSPYPIDWSTSLAEPTLRKLLRRVRQEIGRATAQGYDWRSVIDSLRTVTPRLWQSLSAADQQRFLRHVRPYWDVHRHRVAPEIAHLISQLRQSGQLQICAGRIQSYTEDAQGVDVTIRQRRGEQFRVRSNWVINCTGSEDNYSRLPHPLVQQLLASGLIRPDPLKLGLESDFRGNLVQADGTFSPCLYTLGSPCKGQRWETTAVPEIRVQAKQLADHLLQP